MIVIHWLLLFVYYSTALDNTDISTSGKSKASVSTSGVEVYSKEVLSDEIRRLIATNAQLMTNKIKTKKAKVNLEADRMRLLGEKNSLVVKRKEFRTEIVTLYTAGPSNVPVRRYQNPLLRLTQDKFKVKKSSSFDGLKENFQKFFIRTRYYQGFY